MPAKKFVFRLQIVLEVKIKLEEEEKKRLGELIAWQKHEEQVLIGMENDRMGQEARLRNAQATGQYLQVDELQRINYYLKKLKEDIVAQKLKLEDIERQIEEQRQRLIKAAQERKTLEILKENQHNEWLAEVEEEERKVLDELATLKYAREGTNSDE